MAYAPKTSGIPKHEEIELGARVCTLIKKVYFEQELWSKCSNQVATMFSALKVCARKIYAQKTEKEVLSILAMYDDFDIRTAFDEKF